MKRIEKEWGLYSPGPPRSGGCGLMAPISGRTPPLHVEVAPGTETLDLRAWVDRLLAAILGVEGIPVPTELPPYPEEDA